MIILLSTAVGHVMYEMCVGVELVGMVSSDEEYKLIADKEMAGVIKYIFTCNGKKRFKNITKVCQSHLQISSSNNKTLLQILNHSFFDEASKTSITITRPTPP